MRGRSPREMPPLSGEVAAKQAGRVQPVDGGIAKSRAGHARPLRTAVNGLRTRGAREGGSPPLRSGRAVARERVVTQDPSGPFRPRKLGQLPALRGAFPAGEARAKSRPSQGRWPSASDGRRGFATLRFTQTFLQYHLDTTPQPCYSLTIKSVEEEKYRSISAQRAWRLV